MFIAVMAGLRGASGQQVMMAVSQGTWPMTMARLKFWPIAGLAAFTVIPPERRVLFNSFVGMIWVSLIFMQPFKYIYQNSLTLSRGSI